MTFCLGKSYSFGLLCVRVIREHLSVCVRSSFPFGFEGGIWDLIIFFSDHCLLLYFRCMGSSPCFPSLVQRDTTSELQIRGCVKDDLKIIFSDFSMKTHVVTLQ